MVFLLFRCRIAVVENLLTVVEKIMDYSYHVSNFIFGIILTLYSNYKLNEMIEIYKSPSEIFT